MNKDIEKKNNSKEEDEKIVHTHLNDDSNNQYEETAKGEIKYLNENIIELQRSDDPVNPNEDEELPHLTKQDRVI